MLLEKGSITSLIDEAYPTIQVPEYSINIVGVSGNSVQAVQTLGSAVNYPDDWFEYLAYKGSKRVRQTSPRQTVFLYLSEKGWNANKVDIKAAFLQAAAANGGTCRGVTWTEFEAEANQHFYELATFGASSVKNIL